MEYSRLRGDNLPIGSGVVEAACKTLVTQRLRRSGMRWSIEGGQAIMNLRAMNQSGRFDRAWSILVKTYKSEVELPKNVVRSRRRSVA